MSPGPVDLQWTAGLLPTWKASVRISTHPFAKLLVLCLHDIARCYQCHKQPGLPESRATGVQGCRSHVRRSPSLPESQSAGVTSAGAPVMPESRLLEPQSAGVTDCQRAPLPRALALCRARSVCPSSEPLRAGTGQTGGQTTRGQCRSERR
jgi:hypothetical protein